MKKENKIRKIAFWPPFILLIGALLFCIIDEENFYRIASITNDWVLTNLGWTYSLTSFLCLIGIAVAYYSPLGDVILGGSEAKPILSKKNWASITLCTAMAAGAVFWGMAEPIYHMADPPVGIEPNSVESAMFAMETMILHWSIHPYSLYTLPVIAFAFAFFNMRKSFTVSSQLSIITDKLKIKTSGNSIFPQVLDAILLFSMGLGILGVLATGTLNMGAAIQTLTGMESKYFAWFIILLITTIAFTLSSISGIQKGIKILSKYNVIIYFILLGVIFLLGPTIFMIDGTIEAVGSTISKLPAKLLTTGAYAGDPWAKNWTVFYAGSWASWAPISACFLARLGVGYKIKDLIKINFVIPILFNILWVGVFSNLAINMQLTGTLDLIGILQTQGAETVIYAILRELPFSTIIIFFFFIALMMSLITAMDSTTNSIASLSTSGISAENQEAPIFLKVIWGVLFSILTYMMLTIAGIGGIKMVSNLGGLPNIFILMCSVFCIFVISSNVNKYNIVNKKTDI